MTTHSATDLKPGDFVQHPERRLNGLVVNGDGESIRILYLTSLGAVTTTSNLTGWERVETCTTEAARILEDYQQIASKSVGVVVRDAVVMMTPAVYEAHHGRETVRPGHVQVRVDDLDPQTVSGWSQWSVYCTDDEALVRVGRAMIASQVEHGDPSPHWPAESTPPADEQEADFAIGWLNCPWCSESFTIAPRLARDADGHVRNVGLSIAHICPPAQPDEPTEFGARVTVTLPDGTREKWLRQVDGWWVNEQGGSAMWKHLIKRGTVTIGWNE